MRRNTEAERWKATGTLQTGSTQVQTAIVMDSSVWCESIIGTPSEISRNGYTEKWASNEYMQL